MRFRRTMVSLFAFLMVATLLPTSASASEFRIRIEDLSVTGAPNGYGVVIKDNGDGDFDGNQAGSITIVQGSIYGTDTLSPNVSTNLNLAYSEPTYLPPAPGVLALLELTAVEVTVTGATTVRLTLEDTDYASVAGQVLQIQNSIFLNSVLPAGATITTNSWAALAPPDLGALQSTPGGLSPLANLTAGAFSTSALPDSYALFTTTGPTYSLFTQLVIVFTAAGTVSFDQNTTVTLTDKLPVDNTPEPGSLMLIATALVGLASKRGRSMLTRG